MTMASHTTRNDVDPARSTPATAADSSTYTALATAQREAAALREAIRTYLVTLDARCLAETSVDHRSLEAEHARALEQPRALD